MERGEERPQEPVEALIDSQGKTTSGGGEITPFAALQEQEQASPEILELLSTLYDTYTLRNSLQSAAEEQQSQQNIQDLSSEATESYNKALNIDPAFTERYRRGILFIDATMHILRGSFTDYPENPEYLKNVLDAAFLPYGFKVTEGSVAEAEKEENFNLRLAYQRNAYEESPSRAKKISSNILQFYSGEEEWGAIGQWQDTPEVIQFAQAITKINDLHANMPPSNMFVDNDDEKTVNISGLHPNYRERYYWAGKFLEETKYIMTEGINPYEYRYFRPLISLVNHFNDALKSLDMHIDVNPDWQLGQTSQPRMEQEYRAQEEATPYTENDSENFTTPDFEEQRNYWITDRGANVYELSQKSVENPAVRHYIGLEIDTKQLWGDIYTEAHAHRQANWLDGRESFYTFLDELENPSASEVGPSIGVRLFQAEQIMEAIERVMEDRLGYMGNIHNSIASHIKRAVKPLGLHVSYQPVLTPEKRAEIYQLLSSQQENVWQRTADVPEEHSASSPTVIGYRSFIEQSYTPPSEKTSPEELARFAEVAQELHIPEEQWHEERVLGFVTVLIESRDLHAKFQEGEREPGAPGLVPPVAQRLQTSAEMMQVVVSLLEAGFKKRLDKTAITEQLNNALTANYGITVTETPQTENSEASQEDTTPLPWQQKIVPLIEQEGDAEAIKAFPNEPLELLENLYWDARMQKDTNAAYILEGLIDGYVASAFPFLPPLALEKYTEQYYKRGDLTPTEEEEGFRFTDEEYSYLSRLLESANIAELYKQKGEGEIPYFKKGENEQYIRLNPVLTEMRKIATKLGLDWEHTQNSSVDEEA